MYNDLFCKIFIDSDFSLDYLIRVIEENLDTKFDSHLSIETSIFILDLSKNSEYNQEQKEFLEDGFLYYPYLVEFYKQSTCTNNSDYISDIKKFLIKLNDYGIKSIVACDFEDQLPHINQYKITCS
ncbi:hypothetical protein LVJ83_11080 [Uruburuella testudinis]|uniref:PIN domain-containing protein n=1 Tax=Uruburuella testudinis TaxID=1282863 RepID=A0ABY4DRG4_9NEIS|nr:hypothetical protein [Uruburuella testudinis]UOO81476.1 hypothetical protein LVJ83_11080 [Uruburuella testudinis]